MTLETLLILIGFVFGAVCGSFFNVVIYRLPVGESIVMPPSHCRKCGEPINWYDNIPLVSYIVLGGRCRSCKAPYSFRYFTVELLSAVLFALVVSRYVQFITGGSVLKGAGLILFHFFFVGGMTLSAFTDLDHHIIPNEVTYPGVPLGLLAAFLFPQQTMGLPACAHWKSLLYSFVASFGAASFLFVIGELVKRIIRPHVVTSPAAGVFRAGPSAAPPSAIAPGKLVEPEDIVGTVKHRKDTAEIPADFSGTIIRILVHDGQHVEQGQHLLHIRKEALGLGDVKLLAVIGAFLGWKLALLTVLLSSLVGLLGHLLLVIARKSEWHAEIPFGVYIVPASLVSYFCGQTIISWYISAIAR